MRYGVALREAVRCRAAPALALSDFGTASRKRTLVGQATVRISQFLRTGIRNAKIFFVSVYSFVGWAKAPLRRAHHNKAQSLRREVGGHAIGRAFARPMALPTLRSARCIAPATPEP